MLDRGEAAGRPARRWLSSKQKDGVTVATWGPAHSLSTSFSLAQVSGGLSVGLHRKSHRGVPGRQRIWAETKPVLSPLPPTVCP